MFNFTAPPPLSLYIHIPWCIRKCPYCDFNSHKAQESLPEDAYVTRLIEDLEQDLRYVQERPLLSIFFGGGTPSLFSPKAIENILTAVQKRITFSSDIEITLEANPGSVDHSRFTGFKTAGINRLSIGVQSFQDDKLKALGRVHDSQTATQAIAAARAAGFDNFNIDLMYGLPHQTVDDALYDIKMAIALAPKHLSWYQLTLEPNTLFYRQPPPLPDDEKTWQMQERCQEQLARVGLQQYEVSAYSHVDTLCRHNLNYWEFGDYLGIGAGAHSKLTDVTSQSVTRLWKTKHPKDYLDSGQTLIGGQQTISITDMPFEFMLNALRLYRKIPIALFESRTGLSITTITPTLESAKAKGLLTYDEAFIRTTDLGQRFLNELMSMFLSIVA